jgi:hypothetical protein
LAAVDGQLRVTGCDTRELLHDAFWNQVSNDVHEGAAGADWRQLPEITDENQPMNALERLDERAEHLLR